MHKDLSVSCKELETTFTFNIFKIVDMVDPAPNPPKMKPEFLECLKDLYWQAAEKEVRCMIMFYNAIRHSDLGQDSASDIDCKNFKKMFKLWTDRQGPLLKRYDSKALYKETIEKACAHRKIDKEKLWARCLLQSASFLDIDVLYEPPFRPYPSFDRGRPNVEELEIPANAARGTSSQKVLRGIFCPSCQALIRSLFFYECNQGCKDPYANKFGDERPEFFLTSIRHPTKFPIGFRGRKIVMKPAESLLDNPAAPNRRLCPNCSISQPKHRDCKPDHLQKIYPVNPTGKDTLQYQRKISAQEDAEILKGSDNKLIRIANKISHAKQYGYLPESFAPLELMFEQFNIWQDTTDAVSKSLREDITPGGPFHMALMFGPLIFESGVEKTKRGILVIPRPCTYLFSNLEEVSPLVFDPKDEEAHKEPDESSTIPHIVTDALVFYQEKHSPKAKVRGRRHPYRHVEPCRRPIRDRPTAAHVKRVYGAAFSGYNDFSDKTQGDVIDEFVREADECDFDASKRVKAKRNQLHQSSKNIINSLKSCIGAEVDKYLTRIENILFDPKISISYHLRYNNCHKLVSALLGGKDFEYSFPRFPEGTGKHYGYFEDPEWPQYLVSFGERIERTKAEFHRQNSIVERFLNENREFDLVDFLEYSLNKPDREEPDPEIDAIRPLYLLQAPYGNDTTPEDLINTLWEMPRDTLAILQSHLHRPAWKYRNLNGQLLDNRDLLKNRLLALEQLDIFASLAGSLGDIIRMTVLQTKGMVDNIIIPKAHVYGHLHANDKVRIFPIPPVRPINVVYAILRGRDPRLINLFKLPTEELLPFITGVQNMMNNIACRLEDSGEPMTNVFLQSILRAEIALLRCYTGSFTAVIPVLAQLAYKMFSGTRKIFREGGWAYYDFGILLLVNQMFKKTKTVRKKIKAPKSHDRKEPEKRDDEEKK